MFDRVGRRGIKVLTVAVAAAVVAVLGACASPQPSEPVGSTGPVEPSGVFPVTVEHQYGSSTIPAKPTKIVTLGLSDQDPLLALGVTPIAVSPWYGDYEFATWPWAQDELGDATPIVLNKGVRNDEAPPIEELAALQPDLIISLYSGTTKSQYDLLSQIAPTIVPDEGFGNFAITWQEATRVTGEALGREEEALALVDRLDTRFREAAAANPQFAGQRVVVAERFEAGQSVVRAGNDVRATFFSQLGFTAPTEIGGVKPNEYGEIKVSDESMGELSRDLLVWNVGFDTTARPAVEASALYSTLPVVKSGKVLWIEDEVVSGAFSWGTVLSLEYALDELLPQVKTTVG